MAPIFKIHRVTRKPIEFVKFPLALFPHGGSLDPEFKRLGKIAEMKEAELRMYLALLCKSNESIPGQIAVTMKPKDFTFLTGLHRNSVKRARKALVEKHLIKYGCDTYTLLDPQDGSPLLTDKELAELEKEPETDESGEPESKQKKKTLDPVRRGIRDLTFDEHKTYFEHYLTLQGSGIQQYACCPFHDDSHPSMSINLENGKWTCRGGSCGLTGNIVEFEKLMRKKNLASDWDDFKQARNNIAAIVDDPELIWESQFRYDTPVSVYHYRAVDGRRLFAEEKRKNKKFPVYHMEGRSKVWGLGGIKPVLYNLPQIARAGVVILTEGAKDADRVASLNLVDSGGRTVAASTALRGARAEWLPEYSETLRDKKIVILPDFDPGSKGAENNGGVGMKYAKGVRAALIASGIPASDVVLVEFEEPDFPKQHGDVSDFLDNCWDHGKNCPVECQASRLVSRIDVDWLSPIAETAEVA